MTLQISAEKKFRNPVRIVILGLIVFEILNYFKILKFSPDFTWSGLILTSAVVWLGLEFTHYSLKNRGLEFSIILWIVATIPLYFDALGDIIHFYSRFFWYDLAGHFLGSAAAGIIIISILKSTGIHRNEKGGNAILSLLTFTSVVTLGVFYELEEFFEDFFNFTNRFGDAKDTAADLLMDVLGAFSIVLIFLILEKIKHRTKHIETTWK